MNVKIGSVTIPGNIFLAPMAGFTDPGFRALCSARGASLTYTEMISAKGVCYGNAKTFALFASDPAETIKAVQLFGSDPESLARACRDPHTRAFDIIDINCGCPVPKIVGNGDGSAMMRDMNMAEKAIGAAVEAAGDIPVTVKFRAGIDGKATCAEFARMCEGAGAAAVTIHGRMREQYYAGQADLKYTEAVAKAVKIPVIHSGDVKDCVSCKSALDAGAAAVMIGRAALGRPGIFTEIAERREPGKPSLGAVVADILVHMRKYADYFPKDTVAKNMRKHYGFYFKGIPDTKPLREKLMAAKAFSEAENILQMTNNR